MRAPGCRGTQCAGHLSALYQAFVKSQVLYRHELLLRHGISTHGQSVIKQSLAGCVIEVESSGGFSDKRSEQSFKGLESGS